MNSKFRALIVDDEAGARKLLKKLLDETRLFTETHVADSVPSASEKLKTIDPDMIFLDVKMPGKDGFDFLKEMSPRNGRPAIVFVTAYEQYALKAIKNHAFDYLLKPVNRKELKKCICNYISVRQESRNYITKENSSIIRDRIQRVKVSTRTGTLFVNPANILYCKADGNYTILFTGGRELLCSMNIGKIGNLLPESSFIRVGRSHILNLEYDTHLDKRQSLVTLVCQGETVYVKIPRNHLKVLETL